MELIEQATEERLRREDAAERLRQLADELSRRNEVSFVRQGKQVRISIPDTVLFSLEIEVGDDESEVEVELKW